MEKMRIDVVDNFLSLSECMSIIEGSKTNIWNPFEFDTYEEKRYYSGSATDVPHEVRHDLDERVLQQAKELHPKDYKIVRSYINLWRNNEVTFPHYDRVETTCLIYLNVDTLPIHGGETLFFDENQEAIYAVSPKPGRAVFFDGWLLHKATSFNAMYQKGFRMTMAYKLATEDDYKKVGICSE